MKSKFAFPRYTLVFPLLVLGLVLSSCSTTSRTENAESTISVPADHPFLKYSGRSKWTNDSAIAFGYSGARIRMRFEGTAVGMRMEDERGENFVLVWVDGESQQKLRLDSEDGFYELASGLEPGEHTIEVVRVTEGSFGLNTFRGFSVSGRSPEILNWGEGPNRKIEFIGDSITCGYGVEVNDPQLPFSAESENFCLGYSGVTARNLGVDYLAVSRSGIGMVRNFDGPYEGSENTMPELYPDTFYMRPDSGVWDYENFVPDVVCINLGTNDFSTTGVNVDNYVSAYVDFATMLLDRYPEAEFVLIQGPMNNSDELGKALDRVIAALEKVSAERIHFLELSPQGSLGYGADYHPNVAQSQVNAAELTAFLSELMGWKPIENMAR